MKEITTKELKQKIANGEKLNIIDVREVDELAEGKILGIIHIPLGLLEFRMNELSKSESYIMVCRSGGRSGRATQFLVGQGYDVTNMTGGMLVWEGEVR